MFEMLFIAAADLIIPVTYGYAGLLFVVVTCAYPHRMPRPLYIRRCVYQYVRGARMCHTRFPVRCAAAYCVVLKFSIFSYVCVRSFARAILVPWRAGGCALHCTCLRLNDVED